MRTHRSAMRRALRVGLLVLLGLGGGQFAAPTGVEGQADSPGLPRRPARGPAASAEVETPAARELFRHHCAKCHGADGTGRAARRLYPDIPDFASASWQGGRSDRQLLAAILDGRGQDMPPWRGKISEEQARGLVARVRAFAPTAGRPGPQPRRDPGLAGFEERYQRLQEQLDELKRQFRELSHAPPATPSRPSDSPSRPAPPKPPGPP